MNIKFNVGNLIVRTEGNEVELNDLSYEVTDMDMKDCVQMMKELPNVLKIFAEIQDTVVDLDETKEVVCPRNIPNEEPSSKHYTVSDAGYIIHHFSKGHVITAYGESGLPITHFHKTDLSASVTGLGQFIADPGHASWWYEISENPVSTLEQAFKIARGEKVIQESAPF